MNEKEIEEKVENLYNMMTPENLSELSDEDLEKLSELLDEIEQIVEN